ncbi:MAG: hypothetical protein ACEPOZ_02645 [Marinifilaceae bacterium]
MEYDKKKYKVYTWRHWMVLHWIVNPGLAFNELVLGQRVPKISLVDKTSDKPRMEKTYVPCPHCSKLHDGRTWSPQNGTGFNNWFGLYCPNCGGTIPCITNGLSFVLKCLTFPVWGWFRKSLKKRWLEKQPQRYEGIDLNIVPNPFDKKSWKATGLTWGVFMFLVMTFIFPFFEGEEITLDSVLIAIPFWTIAGFGFGYAMKIYTSRTAGKNDRTTTANNGS